MLNLIRGSISSPVRWSRLHGCQVTYRSAERPGILFTSKLAVTPWAMTLSSTVQPAASMIVSLPGSFASRMRIAKTIVASPRGPNKPMKSLSAVVVRVPIKDQQHTYHGQAEQCIEHRRPGDAVDHAGEHDAPEQHPCEQRQWDNDLEHAS